jgi:hypothetical protein
MRIAIKQKWVAGCWESYMTSRRPIGSREDSLWESSFPLPRRLGVIYDSQPVGIFLYKTLLLYKIWF